MRFCAKCGEPRSFASPARPSTMAERGCHIIFRRHIFHGRQEAGLGSRWLENIELSSFYCQKQNLANGKINIKVNQCVKH